MKKILSLLLVVSITKNSFCNDLKGPNKINRKQEAKYFKLESNFLKYLDGVTNRMDGPAIGEVIQVRKLIQDLKNGILSSKVAGGGKTKYEYIIFQNKKTNITQLCTIENQILKQYNDEPDFAVKAAINVQIEELKNCLKQVKHSFIQSTIQFMKRIEPAKPIVVKIMEESCRIRRIAKNDTVILDWSNTNGNEEAVLNDRIKSFPEFSKFLNQVNNFLGDLLKSCPKGFDQYLKHLKGK